MAPRLGWSGSVALRGTESTEAISLSPLGRLARGLARVLLGFRFRLSGEPEPERGEEAGAEAPYG